MGQDAVKSDIKLPSVKVEIEVETKLGNKQHQIKWVLSQLKLTWLLSGLKRLLRCSQKVTKKREKLG